MPRLPARLHRGDKVGIVAPASPFDRGAFEAGVSALREMGYRPVWSQDLFARSGYLAGSDAHRALQIRRMFEDSDIKAVFCARGGYGSVRTLDRLDFASLADHPKIFVGFSDNTALLAAMGKIGRMVTFHGPTVTSLAKLSTESRDFLDAALATARPLELRAGEGVVLHGGKSRGRVVGGNLTTLCHLLGTPYSPDYRGKILLLEDRGEAPYRIDRMLAQMKLAGCLETIHGVVLGSFEQCGDPADIHRIVEEVFAGRGLPILAGMPVGHGRINFTVPMGLEAELDADEKRLSFTTPATVEC